MKKLLLTGLLGLVTLASYGADAPVKLNGAGSSFVQPAMDRWGADFGKTHMDIQINYAGGGSGAGKKGISDGTVDFGASDGPMSDDEMKAAKYGKILHLPVVAGAVVMTYNLPGVTQTLKFDGATIADIYMGKVTKWNDPQIEALNPGVKLPNVDITVAHRADGSGTSYIFTDYLANVSPAWMAMVGKPNTSPKWPTGQGQPQNAGVAGFVQKTVGAIGYVELQYAIKNKIAFADLKNAAGKFITPSLDSVKDALGKATIPPDYRFSFVNSPGDTSYPISGVTWVLVYQNQPDAVKGAKLVEFLKWIYTDGMKSATELAYAPLDEGTIKRIQATIDTIKY